MDNLNALDWITVALVIVGALNWGLVGLFKFNLVETVLGKGGLARTVYTLVGLSGVYVIFLATQLAKN